MASATLGLEGTVSLQFPPISLKVTFQVSAFVLLILFQWLCFAGEINTWFGIEGDLAAVVFLLSLPRVSATILQILR